MQEERFFAPLRFTQNDDVGEIHHKSSIYAASSAIHKYTENIFSIIIF
ncbi:MAG: hypothetical protein V4642_13850 [Bacteroidota bacterium]